MTDYESLSPTGDVEGWMRHAGKGSGESPVTLSYLMVLYGFLLVGGGLLLLVRSEKAGLGLIAAGFALTLVGRWLLRRVRAAGIRIEPAGVRVRNVLSTRFIPWAQIEAFTFRQKFVVRLIKGRGVIVTGIYGRRNDDRIQAFLEQFNRTLERRTGRRVEPGWLGSPLPNPFEETGKPVRSAVALVLSLMMAVFLFPVAIVAAFALAKTPIVTAAVLGGVFIPPTIALIRVRPSRAVARPGVLLRIMALAAFVFVGDLACLLVRDPSIQLAGTAAVGLWATMMARFARPVKLPSAG